MNRILLVTLLALGTGVHAETLSGEWHGTSVCTDRKIAPACKDETVVYDIASKGDNRSHIRADKIVAGERQFMGEFDLAFEGGAWIYEWTAPNGLHGRWRFVQSGDRLTGGLWDVPTGAQIRKVDAKRH